GNHWLDHRRPRRRLAGRSD
ncbi:MAG: hypothetical protein AVDCRST_MAG70-2080, partial [uncultured Thermomicrobiales bacterium]